MALKLHRCSLTWLKIGIHPCWRVQKALDDQGVEYEVVTGPLSRGGRTRVKELTGQAQYPVIEFEDGSAYREESRDMAATISAGELQSKARGAPAAGTAEAGEPG